MFNVNMLPTGRNPSFSTCRKISCLSRQQYELGSSGTADQITRQLARKRLLGNIEAMNTLRKKFIKIWCFAGSPGRICASHEVTGHILETVRSHPSRSQTQVHLLTEVCAQNRLFTRQLIACCCSLDPCNHCLHFAHSQPFSSVGCTKILARKTCRIPLLCSASKPAMLINSQRLLLWGPSLHRGC